MHPCTSITEFIADLLFIMAVHGGPQVPVHMDPVVELELGDLDPLLGRVIAQSAATAPAGSREIRVDTFDAQSNRTGYILINPQTGQFDRFDALSRHTGTGRLSPPPAPGSIPPTLRFDRRK